MAPRKSVPSLQELCLDYVSSNLDIWCPKQVNKYSVTVTDDNHVSRLPNTILNDICKRALQTKQLPLNHLKAIVHEYTDQLDITTYWRNGERMTLAAKIIIDTCRNLTTLNLSRGMIYPKYRQTLLESIPLIESLNYSAASIYDSDVLNIADNCPKLRELDLRGNLITDDGISALCVKGYVTLYSGISLGRCRFIQKLFVTESKLLTDKGAATAILNLPELRHFEYNNVMRVIENIYKEHNVQRKFKLENVISVDSFDVRETRGHWKISNCSIDAVVDLCPNVTRVRISTKPVSDEWFLRLANLSPLEELIISCFESSYSTVNFNDRIIPLLKIIGNNLTYLCLNEVGWINLLDIGTWCTRLLRLELLRNRYYSSMTTPNSKLIFSELQKVKICSDWERYVPSNQLEILLSNCTHVCELNFCDCPTLTDELLLRVFECNSFSELRTFDITSCHKVHVSSILSMLLNSKSLRAISCICCAGIDTPDFDELQNLIRQENFDVTLTYPVRLTVSEMLADILNAIN